METVVRTPEQTDGELHFLTDWEVDRGREREAGAASILFHVLVVLGLAMLPKSLSTLQPASHTARITPLIEPLTELTQRPPNKGKISKELTAEQMLPRPRIQIPRSLLSTTRAAARTLSMPGSPPPPAPAQALPEPPKIDAAQGEKTLAPQIAQAVPPPQIQAQEKPKLAFETPPPAPAGPPGGGGIARPNSSVDAAIRSALHGSGSGRLTVGDSGPEDIGGLGPGINLPPSPGKVGSNLELLSDPMGVDFRPYLIRILATVRRNWFAVMPESAKLGRVGRVGIQFAVNRDGAVPKLVIVSPSGTEAFDRAAVAGISASNPFPPLPAEFKGNQIRLQFNFSYNVRGR